jgi:hypothetical protein
MFSIWRREDQSMTDKALAIVRLVSSMEKAGGVAGFREGMISLFPLWISDFWHLWPQ